MEKITEMALPQLSEGSDPSAMDDNWITNFFDKSRIVTDEEMQDLWSSILAGEANAPGTYSKRTVNFLDDLDKKDAELFRALCSFGWIVMGHFTPLVFDSEDKVYNEQGLRFDTLMHLDSIGLIKFSPLSGFSLVENLPNSLEATYRQQHLVLTLKQGRDTKLDIGKVVLTRIGEELATVCESPGVAGFVDYVREKWKQHIPKEKKTDREVT